MNSVRAIGNGVKTWQYKTSKTIHLLTSKTRIRQFTNQICQKRDVTEIGATIHLKVKICRI